MALGLSVIQTTKEGFLNQLKRFDSVTLNERGEFACWIEGSCNFYIAEDVSATELGAFAAEVEEHHRTLDACESCGCRDLSKKEHTMQSYDDRDVKGQLEQVRVSEHLIVSTCNKCGHIKNDSF